MISASTLLDQVRDAMDDIQHALSQLGRRELAKDQVAALVRHRRLMLTLRHTGTARWGDAVLAAFFG